MKLAFSWYSGKDNWVYKAIVLPYTLCLNFIIFGEQFISNIYFFLIVSAVTVIAFAGFFAGLGSMTALVRKRFPGDQQVVIRLGTIIATAIPLCALFLFLLFRFYETVPYFDFTGNDEKFLWSFFALGLIQVFLAFVQEGIARYHVWKLRGEETEQLRTTYQRTRLHGLRSQVNPHFLFNSLNSLSSLISEEGEEAEIFLNEMSKVYRYMLRNETDTMVTLGEELKFLQSYHYLLNARYGAGLQINFGIPAPLKEKMITPLALQTIIENAFTMNTISKSNPLVIGITGTEDGLLVRHNLQPKTITDDFDAEAGLDNLLSKYNMLSTKGATVNEIAGERTVYLSWLNEQREGER